MKEKNKPIVFHHGQSIGVIIEEEGVYIRLHVNPHTLGVTNYKFNKDGSKCKCKVRI